MIDIDSSRIGDIVRVMDFVAVIVAKEKTDHGTLLTLESPKRIALHQTTLDSLIYERVPWSWSAATITDLLSDFERWVNVVEERKCHV